MTLKIESRINIFHIPEREFDRLYHIYPNGKLIMQDGTEWFRLEIPEAHLEIVWFKE